MVRCSNDEMGLGKTLQTLSFLVRTMLLLLLLLLLLSSSCCLLCCACCLH